MRSAWVFVVITATAVSPACAEWFLTQRDAAQPPPPCHGEAELAPAVVADFHRRAAGGLVWGDDAQFRELLAALESLSAHGLSPEHYRLADLRREADDPRDRDCIATDAWFSAASHLANGKLDPATFQPNWTAARRSTDLASVLSKSIRTGTISKSLSSLAPRQPEYAVLMSELQLLRSLARLELEAVEPLEPRERGRKKNRKAKRKAAERRDKVRVLHKWLEGLGLSGPLADTEELDETTVRTLADFQKEAGLPASGALDSATIEALERLRQSRLDRVRVNLERWRWLPDELGRRHVRANIAGFDVTAFENGSPVRTHAAIVGRLYRRTPVFSDEIAYLVFNPWWETPASLARTDQLKLFSRDPAAPKRMGFQVLDREGNLVDPDSVQWTRLTAAQFPYRLRQAPGDQNPLGRVKMIFPNRHNVYLHDTPKQGLFAQRQRAFSSGCVRVQYALELAEWLLEETGGWDREKIDAALASGSQLRVNLAQKVPVHILYLTATVEMDGGVRFLDDIYGRDRIVLDSLDKRAEEG
ncbi:MAG: murein L,D-transpeptidase [Alphaproteobacteria bacterium]